jgi:hypothetical protein
MMFGTILGLRRLVPEAKKFKLFLRIKGGIRCPVRPVELIFGPKN